MLATWNVLASIFLISSVNGLSLNTTKLIIDVDAGADDAFAILMALKEEAMNKHLKVEAITCVNGNTALDNVVVNVLKTLKTVGRLDIPVFKGSPKSFLVTPPTDNFFGVDGFGDFEFHDPPDPNIYLQKEHAVNALIRIVSENPGEVTLLCIGPLTNVALAIRMDPEFLTKVKQLVIMGGSTEGVGNAMPNVEFNFYIDPAAAYIVFNATDTRDGKIQPIVLIPFESVAVRNDITMSWRMDVLGNLATPEIKLLNKAERYQLEANKTLWGCADCLAAGVITDPTIVTSQKKHYAYAIPEGDMTAGSLYVDYLDNSGMTPNVLIVETLDVEAFKEKLLTGIGGLGRFKP